MAKLHTIGGLLALSLICCLTARTDAAAPSDTIMSASTRGFISVANAKQLQDNWNKTQMGHLVKDEAMKPFVEDLKRQIERKLSDTRTKLGITVEDLRDVASGEIGVGMVEQESTRAAMAITVDVTNNVPAAQKLLGKINEELVQRRKAKASKATAGGVEMTLFAIPPQNEKDIAREAVFFIHQDMLCASDSRAEAEAMVGRFAGSPGNRLADVKPYATTMGRCAAESDNLAPEVRWYVQPFGYARASRSMVSGEELAKRGKDYISILENQGFDAIEGMGGFVNLAAYGSFEVLHRTSVYAPAVTDGPEKYKLAMRIMQFPNAEKMPPEAWIPRSLASYRTFNMDLQNAYEHVGSLFDAIAGYENAFNDAMSGLETDPYGPQINVQKEFIQHIGQRVSLFTDYELPITTKSERFMFMVELKNEAAIAATVEKYMKADPNAEQKEFQGKVVWEIKPAQEEIPELEIDFEPAGVEVDAESEDLKSGAMSTSAVCVTDGHLLIASHLSFLEKMLAAKAKGDQLGDAPDFREVEVTLNQLLPGPVAARCFRRTDEAYRPTYELLRQGKMPESETLLGRLLNRLLTTPEDEEQGVLRKQKVDGRQLPPFEMVRRYFSPAGIVVRSLDDGWFVVGATLTKQGVVAKLGEAPVPETARVR